MCDCMNTTNKMLKEGGYNTLLAFTLGTPSRCVITTLKADEKKKGKPVAMIATCCPFCGEKYSTE